jgi:hypothetical protein
MHHCTSTQASGQGVSILQSHLSKQLLIHCKFTILVWLSLCTQPIKITNLRNSLSQGCHLKRQNYPKPFSDSLRQYLHQLRHQLNFQFLTLII